MSGQCATFLALKTSSVSASNAVFFFWFLPQFPHPSRETPLSFPDRLFQGLGGGEDGGASEIHSPEGSPQALGLTAWLHTLTT